MKTIEITVYPDGRDEGRDPGLHRPRVPRGQPVRRAGARPEDRRDAHGRVPPGPAGRPASATSPPETAPAITSPSAPRHPDTVTTEEPSMTLAERLAEYVRACFTGLWVQSFEHQDALVEIAGLCRTSGWSLATWDIDRGLGLAGQSAESGNVANAADPLAAIRSLNALASPDGTALLVLVNFHRFLGSPEVVQALDTPDRRRQAGPHLRRRPLAGRAGPRRAGEAVRRHRARPARPRPAGGDRPRRRHRAGRAARGRRPGRRPRRGGRADPVRGRGRLQPLAGAPRPARRRAPVGAQGRAR